MTIRQHSKTREWAAGRTLIRRYALALTPAGQANKAAVMATAIPPLRGGANLHAAEATHACTITDSTSTVGTLPLPVSSAAPRRRKVVVTFVGAGQLDGNPDVIAEQLRGSAQTHRHSRRQDH